MKKTKDGLVRHPMSSVYNMDCMKGMSGTPDKFYDLAIVDPPYGIDLANMNMGVGKGKRCSNLNNRKWVAKDWDSDAPNQNYFSELFRVSKHQIIWGGNYFDLPPCKHYLIWNKEIPDGLSFADCEMAWTSFGNAPRIFKHSAYLDKGKIHPTQKPIPLYRYLLKHYAKAGDKILDTHLGSGSSRIACYEAGYDFTGYETDFEYWTAAEARFQKYVSQPNMFRDEQLAKISQQIQIEMQ